MKFKIPIEGVTAEAKRKNLVILSSAPLRALSSSILSPSYARFVAIMAHQLPEDYNHAEPKKLFLETLNSLGLPRRTLGLMTAVDVNNVSVVSKTHKQLTVCAVVTAGVSNPASAGDNAPEESESSTINIILLIDGNLTRHCLVNVVMTATEAKSAALRDLDVRSHLSAELATGTTSDQIAVACTERGKPITFAGTATKLGELIGKTVKEAVETALRKQQSMTPDRPLLKRLEERGISFEKLLNSALEFYGQHSCTRPKDEMIQTLTACLKSALADVNVSALVLAGLRLNEDCRRGFIQDLTSLTAGQTLGMAIAQHIAGTKGRQVFPKLNEEKPGILGELEPVARDILTGVLAGCSTEVPISKV